MYSFKGLQLFRISPNRTGPDTTGLMAITAFIRVDEFDFLDDIDDKNGVRVRVRVMFEENLFSLLLGFYRSLIAIFGDQ